MVGKMEQGMEMPALPLDEQQSKHEVACKFFRAGVSGGPGAITDRTEDSSRRPRRCQKRKPNSLHDQTQGMKFDGLW